MRGRLARRASAITLISLGLFACAAPSKQWKLTDDNLKSFVYVLQYIHKDYVEPIDRGTQIERAMQTMLKASELPPGVISLPGAKVTMQSETTIQDAEQIPFRSLRAFSELFEGIKAKDPSQDDTKLFDAAIRGLLMGLDTRSSYLDKKSFDALKLPAAIGLEFAKRDDAIYVVSTLEGSPAAESGLMTGDVIDAIDGRPLKNVSLTEVATLLRGTPGSTATLSVTAPTGERLQKRIERRLSSFPVAQVKMVAKGIAYVRARQFSQGSARDVREQLKRIAANGMLAAVVLDLRGNSGGILTEAVGLADEFIEDGLIVTIKARSPEYKMQFNASKGRSFPELEKLPLAVLVDGGTASGSEIVVAALQDHKRAIVVGNATAGMASVQTMFSLPNGGVLKLTTGYYVRPNESTISQEGVIPDVCLHDGKMERRGSGRTCSKSVKLIGAPDDPALEFAIKHLHGNGLMMH